ncbi:hypothetical protein KKC88_04135 [Patescibacteria group bacterium]|nr:hypothetical protein [Patescibacteria group bacterium]MBU1673158.1 hypothetical protein [Patescibacteria group bacterium]MBU1964157.1 hypothetical protein [Patescibacteria group bacterium]
MNKKTLALAILLVIILGAAYSQGVFAYKLEVPLGSATEVNSLPEYITIIYRFAMGIISLLCVLMIVFGGFSWITAAGNEQRIGNAKSTILGAIIGLIIALGSYTLLNTISPNLTNLTFTVQNIEVDETYMSTGVAGDANSWSDCLNQLSDKQFNNCTGLVGLDPNYTTGGGGVALKLKTDAAADWEKLVKDYAAHFPGAAPLSVSNGYRPPEFQDCIHRNNIGDSPTSACGSNGQGSGHQSGASIDVNTSALTQDKYNYICCGQETECSYTDDPSGYDDIDGRHYGWRVLNYNPDLSSHKSEQHHFSYQSMGTHQDVCPGDGWCQ